MGNKLDSKISISNEEIDLGFYWDMKKVWDLNLPVEELDINDLIWHFDVPFWEKDGTDDWNLTAWDVINKLPGSAGHQKLTDETDLSYPIDIIENKGRWRILDGLHRLVKLYELGDKKIKVRKVSRDNISEIIRQPNQKELDKNIRYMRKIKGEGKSIMENKRKISILIPYKIENEKVFVYLQRRDKDAKRGPDYFGFWGGGAENTETPEETLKREIKEELDFTPTIYEFLGKYEFEGALVDVFISKVDDSFENSIKILEGQYGKWFSMEEALNEPKLIEEDKIKLKDFYKIYG